MLRGLGWWLFTDVSEQPIGPISGGQEMKFSWSAFPRRGDRKAVQKWQQTNNLRRVTPQKSKDVG